MRQGARETVCAAGRNAKHEPRRMREAERGTNHSLDPGTAAIRKGRGRHVPAA